MNTIETQGRTIEEATQSAATQLGVAASALQVTVLEETKGLFGKTQVRIRAEVVAVAAEPEAAPAPKKRARSTKAAPAPEPEPVLEPAAEPAPEPAAEKRATSRKPAAAKVEEPEEDHEAPADEIEATEEDGEEVLAFLRDILAKADLEAEARVVELHGRYVNVEITGRDAAHLVGKNGEVLNSLQYLMNLILSRHMDRGVRATIDGNHYRKRREDALRNQAMAIATEVRDRGEEAVLPPLPAFERRIVHNSLQGMEGITTYSEGEEPNRRVVIAPAE